jgi:hypothetical protein
MDNKFEIRIKKDSLKQEVHVLSMSLEVAKAFLVLVDSVTKIVENTPNNEQLRISVKEGSVELLVQGEGIEILQNTFLNVIKKGSADKPLVESWRTMQNLFKQNGLEYEAVIQTKSKTTLVYDTLKKHKVLRAKPVKRQLAKTNIEFFEGTLYKIGGEPTSTLYLNLSSNKRIRIGCSIENSKSAKEYLHQPILLSCWSSNHYGKTLYRYCDSYVVKDDSPYYVFKQFINVLENTSDELDQLDMVYDEVLKYLKQKKYNRLKRFLKLFLDLGTDINILHTISLLTQSFKDHVDLKEYANRIESLLERKIIHLNKITTEQSAELR